MLPEKRLPAQAHIERQAAGGAPRILRVQSEVPLLRVGAAGPTELDGGHAAKQKIGKSETGHLAVEVPLPTTPRARLDVRAPPRDRRTQPELMPAAHQREIVTDLVRVCMRDSVAGTRVACDEPADDIDVHAMRPVAERPDPKIGRRDPRLVVAADVRA